MGIDQDSFVRGRNIPDHLVCKICFSVLEAPVKLSACVHYFCKDCIRQWFLRKQTCPICRAAQRNIDVDSLSRQTDPLLRNILEEEERYCPKRDQKCSWVGPSHQLEAHLADDCLVQKLVGKDEEILSLQLQLEEKKIQMAGLEQQLDATRASSQVLQDAKGIAVGIHCLAAQLQLLLPGDQAQTAHIPAGEEAPPPPSSTALASMVPVPQPPAAPPLSFRFPTATAAANASPTPQPPVRFRTLHDAFGFPTVPLVQPDTEPAEPLVERRDMGIYFNGVSYPHPAMLPMSLMLPMSPSTPDGAQPRPHDAAPNPAPLWHPEPRSRYAFAPRLGAAPTPAPVSPALTQTVAPTLPPASGAHAPPPPLQPLPSSPSQQALALLQNELNTHTR